ncbi:hypothetical protein TNCV_364031 [Trichonephila clavipes]|uniref:Uncharacterized protein n=1 Tax=Trichonephila clavipes TaxID=2585209 RepID=A0A8X6SJ46_TRICX|nr:hypothetical protein TNCV_364031 [Trichonephila clavipes]
MPLKTRSVEGLMHIKYVMAQSPHGSLSRYGSLEKWCQIRRHPRHLNVVQNYEDGPGAKISLYFSPVILPFKVTIGPAEKHNTAAFIVTDPLPRLTVGRRQITIIRLCRCPPNVHQSC